MFDYRIKSLDLQRFSADVGRSPAVMKRAERAFYIASARTVAGLAQGFAYAEGGIAAKSASDIRAINPSTVVYGGKGMGKALALDTPIPTPTGWTTMGELKVGDGVRVQNNVSLYDGVTLEDHVFVGPSAVFTNVVNPRSEVNRKNEYAPTLVKRGASIGSNATILCGVTIGERAIVGAGSVVTHDVAPGAIVAGNPAKPLHQDITIGAIS